MKTENTVGAVQNPNQDGTIIVPNAQLQSIIDQFKLESHDIERLQKEFSGSFAIYEEWEGKNANLTIERADQKTEIELAQQGKKAVKGARLAFVKAWEEVKKPYLQTTQALDAIKRFALSKFEPLEDALEEKSLTAARLAQAEKDLLIANRKAELLAAGHPTGEIQGMGEMPTETFDMMVIGAKHQAQMKREQDERDAAQREAMERLQSLKSQLLALGAKTEDDGSIMLGGAKF